MLENAKADVEGVVNSQVVKRLVEYNFAEGDAVCPEFRLGTVDERDFLTLAQAYDVLLKHGVADGKEAAVREAFGLPVLE